MMIASILFLSAVATTPPVATVTTATPLDATVQCFRATLGGMGRFATINTSGGALIDFEFEAVGADGRPAPARIGFEIDDLGTSRTVTASATGAADAPLAAQLLTRIVGGCLPDTTAPR